MERSYTPVWVILLEGSTDLELNAWKGATLQFGQYF